MAIETKNACINRVLSKEQVNANRIARERATNICEIKINKDKAFSSRYPSKLKKKNMVLVYSLIGVFILFAFFVLRLVMVIG